MLEITNLSHTYGSGPTAHNALGGIDLKVAQGELVCIVGPSGCGKSTLLRSIAGLLRPSVGQVTLNGAHVEQTPDNLAVVFQDYSRSLFPWMSVADNVSLPLRRRDWTSGSAGRPRWRRWRRSACTAPRPSTRGNCRGACSRGCPSPAPWPTDRPCC